MEFATEEERDLNGYLLWRRNNLLMKIQANPGRLFGLLVSDKFQKYLDKLDPEMKEHAADRAEADENWKLALDMIRRLGG